MKILIISDNNYLLKRVQEILQRKDYFDKEFVFAISPKSDITNFEIQKIQVLDLKNDKVIVDIINNYKIVFSLHCKQLFPKKLVENVKCINIHPGYNPINRGWYPQVFAIINNLPVGVTIHEIDEHLDHGNIIVREFVEMYTCDTSKDVYDRILEKELELFNKNLDSILSNTYQSFPIENEGNLFLKKDFNDLCKINFKQKGTFEEFYNLLRALSHGEFDNAYFIDEKTGEKIFLSLRISKEK